MIAYKKHENGQVTDLRFVEEDYVAELGEVIIASDVLPAIDTLHSPAYIANREQEEINKQAKDKLMEIDIESVRSIREFLLTKFPDAPQWLKDKDAIALIERGKIK